MWSDDEEDEDEGAGKSDDEEEKWKVKYDKITINGKISQGMYSLYHMDKTSCRPCHLARRRKLMFYPFLIHILVSFISLFMQIIMAYFIMQIIMAYELMLNC